MNIDWGTNVLDKRFKIKYGLMLTCLGALTSCASNKYEELSRTKVLTAPSSNELINYAAGLWESGVSTDLFQMLIHQRAVELEDRRVDAVQALRHQVFDHTSTAKRSDLSIPWTSRIRNSHGQSTSTGSFRGHCHEHGKSRRDGTKRPRNRFSHFEFAAQHI